MNTIIAEAGDSIYSAVCKAIIQAQEIYGVVTLIFNDVSLTISEDSCEYDILEIYRLKRKCSEYVK